MENLKNKNSSTEPSEEFVKKFRETSPKKTDNDFNITFSNLRFSLKKKTYEFLSDTETQESKILGSTNQSPRDQILNDSKYKRGNTFANATNKVSIKQSLYLKI